MINTKIHIIDYNISNDADDGPNLHKTIKIFRKYKKAKQQIDFYEWIKKNNAEYIENSELLTSVYSMFELSDNNDKLNMCEKIRIVNSPVSTEKMRPILEDDGFIFPCNVHYHSAISI